MTAVRIPSTIGSQAIVPQAIVAGFFILALVLYSSLSIHHDVAWLMYCGQRMLLGDRLYVDCVEVNPPISFYLTLLPAYVAQRFDLPANLCLSVYVLSLAAIAIALSLRIFNASTRSETRWMAAILAFALLFTPINNFGQREHFTAILVLPYLFACAARMSGQPVSRPMALIAGLMAGLGFSIKHYFLLVPLVVEIVLAVRQRSLKSPNRLEIYGAILAGAGHAIFVVLAHPEYFTQVAPMAMVAYNGYAVPYIKLLLQPWFVVTLFALGYYWRVRKVAARSTVADMLVIASAAFLVIYVIQDRGWQYHMLPSQVMMMAAALIVIVKTFLVGDFQWRGIAAIKRPLIGISAAALVVQGVLCGAYTNKMTNVLWPIVEKYSPERTYYVLSHSISTGFPLPVERDVVWGSRFPFQWLVPGMLKGQRARCTAEIAPDDAGYCAKLAEINDYVLQGLAEDFERFKPGVVLVDRKSVDDPDDLFDRTSFDLLGFFVNGSPRFAEEWKHYEQVTYVNFKTRVTGKIRVFEIWVRRANAPRGPVQTSLGRVAPAEAETTP